MAFTVIYDACALYNVALRDFLIRVGLADGTPVAVRWSEQILDEVFRNLRENFPAIPDEKLKWRREEMNNSIRDVSVTGHEPLIDSLVLPDPDDRHVLAAAIRCGAQVIVTANMKDFPASTLSSFGVEAQTPDEFVLHLLDLSPGLVVAVLSAQASSKKNPPLTVNDILERLFTAGLERSVAKLRELMTS